MTEQSQIKLRDEFIDKLGLNCVVATEAVELVIEFLRIERKEKDLARKVALAKVEECRKKYFLAHNKNSK